MNRPIADSQTLSLIAKMMLVTLAMTESAQIIRELLQRMVDAQPT